MGFTSAGTHTSIAATTGSQCCLIIADKDGCISSQSTLCPILIQCVPNSPHAVDPFPHKLFFVSPPGLPRARLYTSLSAFLLFSSFPSLVLLLCYLSCSVPTQAQLYYYTNAQKYKMCKCVVTVLQCGSRWLTIVLLQGQMITSSQRTSETAAVAPKPKQSCLMPTPSSQSLCLSVCPGFPSAYGCSFSFCGRGGGKGDGVFCPLTHCVWHRQHQKETIK